MVIKRTDAIHISSVLQLLLKSLSAPIDKPLGNPVIPFAHAQYIKLRTNLPGGGEL